MPLSLLRGKAREKNLVPFPLQGERGRERNLMPLSPLQGVSAREKSNIPLPLAGGEGKGEGVYGYKRNG
ncbi:hypothetical protein [Nitrosococcus oceani]|uniref:hypothetical protein n=1 Tax=Nitrosococcus oceani TaxID=1229 RepID=UPI0004E9054A|nr:hypothetical protein [Nitrosococcus oceani]KFI22577.1 hypothetical protein HW44_09100 [Nitrosococcus oceani]